MRLTAQNVLVADAAWRMHDLFRRNVPLISKTIFYVRRPGSFTDAHVGVLVRPIKGVCRHKNDWKICFPSAALPTGT